MFTYYLSWRYTVAVTYLTNWLVAVSPCHLLLLPSLFLFHLVHSLADWLCVCPCLFPHRPCLFALIVRVCLPSSSVSFPSSSVSVSPHRPCLFPHRPCLFALIVRVFSLIVRVCLPSSSVVRVCFSSPSVVCAAFGLMKTETCGY